ncbi:MAG: reprolysin-like metallopeptidase [Saprospiraceae bacterium]
MLYRTKQNFKLIGLLIAFFAFSFQLALANNSNPWSPKTERTFAKKSMERQIVPKKYKTFHLNLLELQELLSTAPLRFSEEAENQAPVILYLPMPNGEMERFQIFDAPIMEPGLAAKFSMIHSYAGVGIDDPTASFRFDVTQFGFHGMVISARHSSVFIDPYSKSDTEHYISYYKSDFEKENSNFECHVAGNDDNVDDGTGAMDSNASSLLQGDCMLRTYRLALTCTGEYASFHGGTEAAVIAAFNTSMTRVNGVYEREVNVNMIIVDNNEDLIFLDAGTDPYQNNSPGQMIGECHDQCVAIIGSANFDIGHVFSTGGGGLAGLGVVCSGGSKGNGVTGTNNPVGDPFDIDYVSHEMGHQFGANHTQNNSCNRNGATAMEPGSASTIMGYAGICNPNVQDNSDDYFHAISIQEISNYINNGNGDSCPVTTDTGNTPPTVDDVANYTLPISTPFRLTAIGADADGDVITYCWEQMDNQVATMPPVSTNTGGPAFRTYDPTENATRYFPKLNDIVNGIDDEWEELPSVSRNMNFRVTVRDNHMGGGCTTEDDVDLIFSNTAGPFLVENPNTALTWLAGTTETVTWDVAGTDAAPVSCANVDIILSTDGGFTYPITLATGVPNNGSFDVVVPNESTTTARVMVVCSDNIFFDISNENFTIEAPTVPTFVMGVAPDMYDVCGTVGSVDYVFDLTSLAGFNETVTMSTMGVPAGATEAFSQNNFVPTGTTTLTIGNLAGIVDGTYNITITGTAASVTIEEMVTLIVNNTSPSVAVLTSPVSGSNDQLLNTTLSWDAMTSASSYVIEIATSPGFGSDIVETAPVNNNMYTPMNLQPLTVYFWRVRGINTCGEGLSSSWYSFQTAGTGCNTYTSTDTPITISANDVNTINSFITVGDNFTITSATVSMDITHSWVGDLNAILKSPVSSDFDLFDRPGNPASNFGCDGNNLLLTFDDGAANDPASLEDGCDTGGPGYSISGTYQPIDALGVISGESSTGAWELEISDAFEEDGGALETWSLELCFSATAGAAPSLINNTLTVAPNGFAAVPNSNLVATSPTSTSSQITFIILSLPTAGNLTINGMAAGVGSTFTQADIDNNILVYTNTNGAATTDQFNFDIVTPDGGWIQNEPFNIEIGTVTISAITVIESQVTCFNGTDGMIIVNASGANPPLEYSLNGGTYQTDNTFSDLAADIYTVEVKDAMGNIVTTNSVTIDNPDEIIASSTLIGNEVTIDAIGGTGTLSYSSDGTNFQASNIFLGLANSTYTFTIMDANGCTVTTMETINLIQSAAVATTPTSCENGEDGTLTVSDVVGGVAPYLYSIDNNNFVSSTEFTGLPSGNYTVYVMDASGNTFNAGSYTIGGAPSLSVTGMINDNSITATGLGGTGALQYSINGTDFQTNPEFLNLMNGTYTITVIDENGCTSVSGDILIDFTSLNEIDFDLSFDLFPNPTQDQLNIELNQPTEQKLSFQIFDVTGKLVQEIQFTKNNSYLKEQVDVSRLAAGSYEVLLSDGEMLGRARFVKM